REHLEKELGTFALRLKPLTRKEQINFLTNFWQKQNPGFKGKTDKIRTYSKTLIDNISKSISDHETEFTGIPLQTRMVAEVFGGGTDRAGPSLENIHREPVRTGASLLSSMVAPLVHGPALGTDNKMGLREYLLGKNDSKTFVPNNQVNLVDLYEKIIRKKFDINYQEKGKIDISNVSVKQILEREYRSFKI